MQKFFSSFPPADLVQEKPLFEDISQFPDEGEFLATVGKAKGWQHLLSKPRLKTLWVANLKPENLVHIARLTQLEMLVIRMTRAESLSDIGLLTGLRHFAMEDATRIKNLDFLAPLKKLEAVWIRDAPRLRDISGLAGLKSLSELSLTAGMWNKLKLKTLAPLATLENLTFLTLGGTVDDASLEPIASLKKLKELGLGGLYPFEEYARLAGRLPHATCNLFEKPWVPFEVIPCPRCGQSSQIIIFGKRPRRRCQQCDAEAVGKILAEFLQIKRQAQAR